MPETFANRRHLLLGRQNELIGVVDSAARIAVAELCVMTLALDRAPNGLDDFRLPSVITFLKQPGQRGERQELEDDNPSLHFADRWYRLAGFTAKAVASGSKHSRILHGSIPMAAISDGSGPEHLIEIKFQRRFFSGPV
jgi:hypothetical protein